MVKSLIVSLAICWALSPVSAFAQGQENDAWKNFTDWLFGPSVAEQALEQNKQTIESNSRLLDQARDTLEGQSESLEQQNAELRLTYQEQLRLQREADKRIQDNQASVAASKSAADQVEDLSSLIGDAIESNHALVGSALRSNEYVTTTALETVAEQSRQSRNFALAGLAILAIVVMVGIWEVTDFRGKKVEPQQEPYFPSAGALPSPTIIGATQLPYDPNVTAIVLDRFRTYAVSKGYDTVEVCSTGEIRFYRKGQLSLTSRLP